MQFPGDTHYVILIIKIGSRVCFVGCSKIITLKSLRYWENAETLYFTNMKKSPQ